MSPRLIQKRFRSLIVAGATCASCTLGGCVATQDAESDIPGLGTTAIPGAGREAASPLDPRVNSRVAQAQRDVDAYLEQRSKAAGQPAFNGEPDSADGQAPPPAQARRVVVFNELGGGDRATPNPEIDTAPVEQSSLFRDPVDQTEVQPFTENDTMGLAPNRLGQLLFDLRRELYIEGAHSDQPLKQLLPIAAMALVDPGSALDPAAVPDLTETERELLGALQGFFKSLGERLDEGDDVEEAIAAGVIELRKAVIKEPELQLPTLALCYAVEGFGRFDRFQRNSFLAHSGQRVIVYVEVDDFTSETNAKGEWVTELAQQVTIYSDRDGIPVWRSGDLQTAVDVAQNKRHDFFLLQIIALPPALSVGKYHLKVRVRDEKSGAEAEKAIEFEMVADPKMATGSP